VLALRSGQVECFWDEVLPIQAPELPEDLACLDRRRTRLKGDDGMRTWTGWAIFAYDLDTLTIRTR
jgi:hypothetical protein